MKKLLLLMLCMVLLLGTISSQEICDTSCSSCLGVFALNNNITLKQFCDNCTYVNISSVTYPNSTTTNYNLAMTKDDFEYTYVINATSLGHYSYNVVGDKDGDIIGETICFTITKSGEQNLGDNFIIFLYILFIISILGLITFFILTLAKLALAKETIYGVLINWGFFILMIIVNFLAKSYVDSYFIENISSFFITITTWSNGVLPLISLVITMFIKSTKKKKNLSVQELTGGNLMRYG